MSQREPRKRCLPAPPGRRPLTGRVRCGRCGQAYVGTAAHGRNGRNGRYTYYTCFTRARYGTKHCANDRLPAERLEQAVTRRLWQVLDDSDLIDRAITETYEHLSQRDDEQQSELGGIQDKITETRAALDRYFRAFEAGTMPEDTCAPRIASLSEQAKHLSAAPANLPPSKTTTSTPSASAPPTSTSCAATYTPCSTTATPSASRRYSPSHDRRSPRGCTRSDRTDLPRTGGSH